VTFRAGGVLEKITGEANAMVNSLHAQGVNRLGEGLTVEAKAEDGLIEGFTVSDAPGFALAVQWHPEWKVLENPVSTAIFRAYGDACRAYRLRELTRLQ
jgi:putative glutamine amidotransferase